MARGYGSRAELREMMLEQFQLMPNAVGTACMVCAAGLMGSRDAFAPVRVIAMWNN